MATRLAPSVAAGEISFEDFLRTYDGIHVEWVAGSVVPMTPVSPRNQRIANFLVAVFQLLADATDEIIVLSAPVQMKCGESAREPDVMLLRAANASRVTGAYVDGPADLVVEVISPDSRMRDRGEKFYEYEQAGVGEYWLIEPARRQADQFRLNAEGIYESVPVAPGGRLESPLLPGAWVDPAWLWSDRLPKLNDVQRAWGLS